METTWKLFPDEFFMINTGMQKTNEREVETMMTHLQRCDRCRYVGEMDYVHGHHQCPQCKQQIAFGDCCQGSPIPTTFSGPQDACDIDGGDLPN